MLSHVDQILLGEVYRETKLIFVKYRVCVIYHVLLTIIKRSKRNECVTYLVLQAMTRRNILRLCVIYLPLY